MCSALAEKSLRGRNRTCQEDKNSDFEKNKTLNNFKKNQNQIEYFVIILAIIKTSEASVC